MRYKIDVEYETSGEELFSRYRDTGDEQAFSALYDAFNQRLFASGVRYFKHRYGHEGARVMASDAAHETWTRIIGGKDQWSGTAGSFAAWATAIHYHCVLEMIRDLPDPDDAAEYARRASATDPDRRILARTALELFSDQLTPEEATVLMAYYLTADRNLVAAFLGISQVALRKRIERIKEALKSDSRFGELLDALGIDGSKK